MKKDYTLGLIFVLYLKLALRSRVENDIATNQTIQLYLNSNKVFVWLLFYCFCSCLIAALKITAKIAGKIRFNLKIGYRKQNKLEETKQVRGNKTSKIR